MTQSDTSSGGLFDEGSGLLDRILERVRCGEILDLDALALEFPDMAEELPRLVAMVDFIHGASQTLHPLRDLEARLASGEFPRIDAYEVQRLLARGGMGVVYEANEPALDRVVAIKVLSAAGGHSERDLERFRREARSASRLNHPNIVPIYSVGDYEGVPYYSMRLVTGPSLAQVSRERRRKQLPLDGEFALQVACWGKQIADALAHAHLAGVIHRDVKPSNILTDEEGVAFVTDFGLARKVDDATLTVSGDLIGTMRYMSPEQARGGGGLDERTDVYSLGAAIYELLALQAPFDGEEREEILRKVLLEEPVALRSLQPAVPEALATIVHKALSKRREDRYQSAALLRDDFERFLAGERILARPPTVVERVAALDRRYPRTLRTALVALMLLSLLGVVSTLQAVRIAKDRDRIALESERSLRIQEFLTGILFYGNPKAVNSTQDLDGILDRIAIGIGEEFKDDPATQAELRYRLGDVYWTRSRLESAEVQLRLAIENGRAAYGASDAWVVNSTLFYADLINFIGRFDECLLLLDEMEPLVEDAGSLAALLLLKADALVGVGRESEASDAMERALELRTTELGPDHWETGKVLEGIAELYIEFGQLQRAVSARREVIRILSANFGEEHPEVLIADCNLATTLGELGTRAAGEEAERVLQETIERMSRKEDPSVVDLGWARGLLASIKEQLGQVTEAEQLHLQALKSLETRLGSHVLVIQATKAYGVFLNRQGRQVAGLEKLDVALAMSLRLLGEESPGTEALQRLIDNIRLGQVPK